MVRTVLPKDNVSEKNNGAYSWSFETEEFVATVYYDDVVMPDSDKKISLSIERPGSWDHYIGEDALEKIEDLLGYKRDWLFVGRTSRIIKEVQEETDSLHELNIVDKEEYDEIMSIPSNSMLFAPERLIRARKTNFFVTCFSIGKKKNYLRRVVDRMMREHNIDAPDGLEKYDSISSEMLDSRCFGWYEDLDDAIYVVENNVMDIHECSFKHAVIEEVRSGPYPSSEALMWFEWSGEEEKYIECDRPKEIAGRCNFCF